MRLQPITRKERFLYEIVGWGETAPKNELTTEELFFAKILGRNVTLPDLSNVPRYYLLLAKIAGENVNISPPTHVSPPLEFFLAKAAGMDVVTPVPLTKEEIFWANYKGIEQIIEGIPPLTFKSNGANLSNYRIYGNTVNGESVGDLVENGEHTGEYRVPVTVTNGTDTETTNIYLPEQIKKVGDEAEYIDYGEQKQHRVRKNLLLNTAASQTIDGVTFTVNSDGSVTCNGTANNVVLCEICSFPRFSGECILSGCPMGGSQNTYRLQYTNLRNLSYKDYGTGVNIYQFDEIQYPTSKINIRIESGYTCNNLTFYPMIRKADIEDDTYEPYIADTELDVTLPTLPTLSGTNTMSVEATVQPSKVVIKTGKFGTHKVRYYDSDGTFLSAEDVKDGTNAQGFTPTKTSTVQYNYTFMGWSTIKGSTIAETGVLNDITADKSLYAVFSQSLRTFTVYFYNGSTLLQTAENVQYGGTATYTGATPTSSQAGYIFSGWSPSNTNITADTSCYAQFVDEDMYESISDTWSEIIANVSNGTYSTKYQVGDTKKIDLGTEGEVIMTIVGIDADDLADDSGKAPITWISKQLLKTYHRMNPSYSSGTEGTGSLGGWEKTEMRSYLKETVKPLIPEIVRNAIKPVKKYTRIYNVSETVVNDVVTTDDVWIPSYKEVFGTGRETQGPTYSTAFPDNASRIKSKVGSSAAWWWLRSANSSSSFYYVFTDGFTGGNRATGTGGVAVGFVI